MKLGTLSLGDCVVGGVDPATGDTIASCPAPPCLTGSGPLAPGQSYCAGDQISQACPSGMQMDPVRLVCAPIPSSLIAGIPNSALYVAGGILLFVLFAGKK